MAENKYPQYGVRAESEPACELIMIAPNAFGFNHAAAVTNVFMTDAKNEGRAQETVPTPATSACSPAASFSSAESLTIPGPGDLASASAPPPGCVSGFAAALAEADGARGDELIREQAMREFDDMVALLRAAGVVVHTVDGPPDCADAVFSNNWLTTHRDAKDEGLRRIFLFP